MIPPRVLLRLSLRNLLVHKLRSTLSVLGVLFISLVRRGMVEDPELPFPESQAASEIHKAGQRAGSAAKFLVYNIGFGGLDHVLSLNRDVNILVLDTEVYSNTGGQQSKATPMGASAKFASAGKTTPKKDLALMAMAYGSAYVARVAMGAKDAQTVKAFREAEAYPGPSIIIAYSHCIAHGYDLACGLDQQKLAVASGHWPLVRFDPRRPGDGQHALVLDFPRLSGAKIA